MPMLAYFFKYKFEKFNFESEQMFLARDRQTEWFRQQFDKPTSPRWGNFKKFQAYWI